ncbi:MAG: DTW domain-containing protein [Bdellovibrionales bacterium]|nr:DTW domain-containing protein [Bdellovibrionales bacterium]
MSITIQDYLERRRLRLLDAQAQRFCQRCLRPTGHCFCAEIRAIDPGIEFAILVHPIERRRKIATGRMAHLSLKNSHFISGHDFTDNARVNAFITNSAYQCVVMYPGPQALKIDEPGATRSSFFDSGKKLTVFVIDGTWHTARRTLRDSKNLQQLRRICFSSIEPSLFRVRKQPAPECFSTIEAIHRTIELLGPRYGFDVSTREHDQILRPFHWMVDIQIRCGSGAPQLRRVSPMPKASDR